MLALILLSLAAVSAKKSVKSWDVKPRAHNPVGNSSIQSWVTLCDDSGSAMRMMEPQTVPVEPGNHKDRNPLKISIDLDQKQQEMVGFGAGLPQASAYTLLTLKQNDLSRYKSVLDQLFSVEYGAGMNMLRIPIGSCDFSMTVTSYDESDWDFDLQNFALDADTANYIVPVLWDIQGVNPDLRLIGTGYALLFLIMFFLISRFT